MKKLLLLLALAMPCLLSSAHPALEVVGYFPGWSVDSSANANAPAGSPFEISSASINAHHLTVINYAFLDICWNGQHGNPAVTTKNDLHDCLNGEGNPITPANGSIVLGNPLWDADVHGTGKNNLAKLLALKTDNPKLKLIASVGGWDWSNHFSQTAAKPETRSNFANSAVEFLRLYHFDGIDIDWEYPTSIGIACAPEQQCDDVADKTNYILLVQTLRQTLDQAGKEDGKHYVITIAAGSTPKYIQDNRPKGSWMTALAKQLDWINLMNYDYHGPWDLNNGFNAPLHRDRHDTSASAKTTNSDAVVNLLLQYVPANKIVLGMPFYGYGWSGCQAGPKQDGLYQPCKAGANGMDSNFSFSRLTEQGYLVKDVQGNYTHGAQGFVRHWSQSGQVPYLYNPESQIFISYEDEQSIHLKDRYLLQRGLRGAMFWELNADRGLVLGTVVAQDLLGK